LESYLSGRKKGAGKELRYIVRNKIYELVIPLSTIGNPKQATINVWAVESLNKKTYQDSLDDPINIILIVP
jgi:hypothetical protein